MDRVVTSNPANRVPAQPFLSFSIERILAKEPIFRQQERRKEGLHDPSSHRGCEEAKPPLKNVPRLPWLAYTRYCPPKIPRSKSRKVHRRHKLDRNPRIPFSSSQLAALEDKFLQTHYLSGSDVVDLSSTLRVSEHRIKIWFQNRRAREKKMQAGREETGSKP